MSKTVYIDQASEQHLEQIKDLLIKAHLPYSDVTEELLQNFFVLYKEDILIGCIGFESYPPYALLRSLVLSQEARGLGFGKLLVHTLEERASDLGIEHLYLLTTTADRFFEKEGYTVIERKHVPPSIQRTTEFSTLCPDSAICMMKKVKDSTTDS